MSHNWKKKKSILSLGLTFNYIKRIGIYKWKGHRLLLTIKVKQKKTNELTLESI